MAKVTFITGPSGSGKSTLLRDFNSEQVLIFDDFTERDFKHISELLKAGVDVAVSVAGYSNLEVEVINLEAGR